MGLPRKLKNFALFNDGIAYVGEVDEVTLPKLSRKMEDWRGGGMNGSVKADFGLEPITLEWKAGGILREPLEQFGALKHDKVLLRFAGALQADDSETVQSLEVVVRGRHSELDFGNAKAGDKTEFKVKTEASYYKLSIDGATVIEIDVVNMVEVVNGVDLLADVRAAIGI